MSTWSILVRKSQPKRSVLYNSYWHFAAERQRIFFKRMEAYPQPWTNDPVLSTYKFTNAYRATDRISQFLLKTVIYGKAWEPLDIFFRVMVFKTFNRISTWEMISAITGEITWDNYSYGAYNKVLEDAIGQRKPIYSPAYIMPSGKREFGNQRKHQNHLMLLERMVEDELYERLQQADTMEQAYYLLRSYPTIGDFLAYQYTIDLNYSDLTSFSEMEFVKAGPGAVRGIGKCFVDRGGYTNEDIIKMMADSQEGEFQRLGIAFQTLWGRPLQLIDCQNLFCEIDKYARVAFPTIDLGKKRIKQRFVAHDKLLTSYYFPPKWGLVQ